MNSEKDLKKRTARMLTLLLTLICSLVVSPVALAIVRSTVDEEGVLLVTGEGDDRIRIWCSDGKLWINGVPPDTGPVNCSDITKIVAFGGSGDNEMDLSGIARADFPGLSDGDIEMYGGDGNDVMSGSEFGDKMYGGPGEDTQFGFAGDDVQHGGDDDDTQHGGTGMDEQHGGDGEDWQDGGQGDDIQHGDASNDTQWGDAGNDTQWGGDGHDEQDGGAGGDRQYGDDGNDTQYGGAGEDGQFGDAGNDIQHGGDDTDVQTGGYGNDEQHGDDGDDTQIGNAGADTQYGGYGSDTQNGGDDDDIQDGGPGSDFQHGHDGDDVQWGGSDGDEQHGGKGADTQYGDGGPDSQIGGEGEDQQYGGPGNDLQYGDNENDTQYGGIGNDTQEGGPGHDMQYGGPGDDVQTGGEGDDCHFLFFGSADVVNDVTGDDTLDASGVTSPITIDLDLQDADQVVDAAGNTLQLQGQFETFVGGPFADVVSARPLTVPRSIDGGIAPPTTTYALGSVDAQQGDILNFNAYGLPLTDTGTSLIVAGFAPVTYTNFATVTITNVAADLSIGKQADPQAVVAGKPVTYTLTITNAGPTTPVTATVVDTFSDPTALASVTSDGDCAWSPGSATVSCRVTDIVSGTPAHLKLAVATSVSATGVLSNTAAVTPSGGLMDVNAGNNVDGPIKVTFKQTIYLPLVLRLP